MPELKQLPRMNMGMLNKADEFLQEEKTISTRTGLRFIIEMMAEQYRALESMIEAINSQRETIQNQQKEIETLKNKSLIMIIERNPKLASILFLGTIVIANFVPIDYIRKLVFIKLGIPDPIP